MRDASLDEFFSSSDEEAEEDEPASEDEVGDVESEAEPEPEPETAVEAEADSENEPESDLDPPSDTEAEPEGPPRVEEVEPARSTFAWSPDGATCAECGKSVEERWESEVGLVCVECKEW